MSSISMKSSLTSLLSNSKGFGNKCVIVFICIVYYAVPSIIQKKRSLFICPGTGECSQVSNLHDCQMCLHVGCGYMMSSPWGMGECYRRAWSWTIVSNVYEIIPLLAHSRGFVAATKHVVLT